VAKLSSARRTATGARAVPVRITAMARAVLARSPMVAKFTSLFAAACGQRPRLAPVRVDRTRIYCAASGVAAMSAADAQPYSRRGSQPSSPSPAGLAQGPYARASNRSCVCCTGRTGPFRNRAPFVFDIARVVLTGRARRPSVRLAKRTTSVPAVVAPYVCAHAESDSSSHPFREPARARSLPYAGVTSMISFHGVCS
jgi:hypothetical protein